MYGRTNNILLSYKHQLFDLIRHVSMYGRTNNILLSYKHQLFDLIRHVSMYGRTNNILLSYKHQLFDLIRHVSMYTFNHVSKISLFVSIIATKIIRTQRRCWISTISPEN